MFSRVWARRSHSIHQVLASTAQSLLSGPTLFPPTHPPNSLDPLLYLELDSRIMVDTRCSLQGSEPKEQSPSATSGEESRAVSVGWGCRHVGRGVARCFVGWAGSWQAEAGPALSAHVCWCEHALATNRGPASIGYPAPGQHSPSGAVSLTPCTTMGLPRPYCTHVTLPAGICSERGTQAGRV